MVLEEFSLEKKAIIDPTDFYQEIPGIPKVAVSCYSFVTFERMLATFDSYEVLFESIVANMYIPVYKAVRGDREYVIFNCDVGAPMAAGLFEEVYHKGVDTVIIFGTCGVLDSKIDDCAIIIPDSAIRDEGTSYHYAPPSDEIAVNLTLAKENLAVPDVMDSFVALLEELGIRYTKGKTWTTDAFFRETRDKLERRKAAGCVCVDMECSALAAVAQFRGKNAFSFFYAADNLDSEEWDERSLGNNENVEEKDKVAELALLLADRISK